MVTPPCFEVKWTYQRVMQPLQPSFLSRKYPGLSATLSFVYVHRAECLAVCVILLS